MFSYVFFVVALIVALVLVQPIEGETNEGLHALQEPLCRFVRSAVRQTQFEEKAEASRTFAVGDDFRYFCHHVRS